MLATIGFSVNNTCDPTEFTCSIGTTTPIKTYLKTKKINRKKNKNIATVLLTFFNVNPLNNTNVNGSTNTTPIESNLLIKPKNKQQLQSIKYNHFSLVTCIQLRNKLSANMLKKKLSKTSLFFRLETTLECIG